MTRSSEDEAFIAKDIVVDWIASIKWCRYFTALIMLTRWAEVGCLGAKTW